MKVKVSVDVVPYKEKPPGGEIPSIKRRTALFWREIELENLADLNGAKGHSIIPAHLDGGMATEHCVAMQLLVLDFDHKCTYVQIKDRCDSMGLRIAYAYHTLSSSSVEEKFRVVFVCEEVIEDLFIIKAAMKMLYRIFPECDGNCKNPDRMFFGGKELIYIDPSARIALVQLFHPLMEVLDVGKHFADNLRKFASDAKILLSGKHLAMGRVKDMDAILGENVDSAVIHKTGESTESPFFIAEKMDTGGELHQGNTCGKGKKRKKKKLKKMQKNSTPCQLLNDFNSGKWLEHDTRFAVYTNLINIESELEQCVGRARLLRQDCSVYVFSCFPCEQAKIHIRNYLQDYDVGVKESSRRKNYFS